MQLGIELPLESIQIEQASSSGRPVVVMLLSAVLEFRERSGASSTLCKQAILHTLRVRKALPVVTTRVRL